MAFIQLAGVIRESIVDGPGIRFVVFGQGCPHACPGCHNPDTHSFDGGYAGETRTLLAEYHKNPLLKGITLSGGEPFVQARAFAVLAAGVRAGGGDVMVYSGYTFEHLISHADGENCWGELLGQADLLVDGQFVLGKKTMLLPFRGSSNQRLLDVPASIAAGGAVASERLAHPFGLTG